MPHTPKKIPMVTHVVGTPAQIFSSPQVTPRPLPTISGAVGVTFKHETAISGMAVGPVVVTARDLYEAWLKAHGTARVTGRGEIRFSYPYGATPDGRHDLGWVTKHAAQEVAGHYGVTLEEI